VLNLASTYNACILLAFMLDLLPIYAMGELFAGWGSSWNENLGLVAGNGLTLARDLLLLLVLPAFLLPAPQGRFLVLLSLVLVAVFANPLTGPIFFELLSAGVYWRVAYLFPLPLCAGLLAPAFARSGPTGAPIGRRVVIASLALASIALAFERAPFMPGKDMSPVWLKRPLDYRFSHRAHSFSLAVAESLDGHSLLAPQAIVHVLPLLNPAVRLESARSHQTEFTFFRAGREVDGRLRVKAQELVTNCQSSPIHVSALAKAVEGGVDAVVLGTCPAESRRQVEELLRSFGSWSVAHESAGYTLLLRADVPR
jgi:hypothetical protein